MRVTFAKRVCFKLMHVVKGLELLVVANKI